MALSLNPLADPVKISEKEGELETLKSEIQRLEIKIQKNKNGKKKLTLFIQRRCKLIKKTSNSDSFDEGGGLCSFYFLFFFIFQESNSLRRILKKSP